MDWGLDTATGDLDIENGDVAFVTGVDAIAQHCTIRFRTFLGEYWLNRNIGIDYFGDVLVKNPNIKKIESIFRQTILTTPGVIAILSFSMELDNAERLLTVEFRANTTEGPLDFSEEFVLL